jgi:hypothetical protein
MHERGKSDRFVVPANPPNKATAAEVGEERERAKYYSRSFTKGYRSWPSVADLDRQETTHSDDRGLTRAGTTRM